MLRSHDCKDAGGRATQETKPKDGESSIVQFATTSVCVPVQLTSITTLSSASCYGSHNL